MRRRRRSRPSVWRTIPLLRTALGLRKPTISVPLLAPAAHAPSPRSCACGPSMSRLEELAPGHVIAGGPSGVRSMNSSLTGAISTATGRRVELQLLSDEESQRGERTLPQFSGPGKHGDRAIRGYANPPVEEHCRGAKSLPAPDRRDSCKKITAPPGSHGHPDEIAGGRAGN
jgi:hypothetical protein